MATFVELAGTDNSALRAVLERFDSASGRDEPVREEVVASWRRSLLAGVPRERFVVPYEADTDRNGRLIWAAESIIDQLASDLEGTGAGIILTDERGRVLARKEADQAVGSLLDRIYLAPGFVYREDCVGTNAIGTAIAKRGASVVLGHEHFVDALTSVACAAVTVSDPESGRVVGVVDLTSAAQDASAFMLPVARRVAREIEHRLLESLSLEERVLRERFLKSQRLTGGRVIALNEHTILISDAAADTVRLTDREVIWSLFTRVLLHGEHRVTSRAILSSGQQVAMRWEPVFDGPHLAGTLVYLTVEADRSPGVTMRRAVHGTARFGWSSLTQTERVVADHVAEGLTNAEVAASLVVSPHTIDYHLRQVFRKLDVRSRVELTRTVIEARAATR